LRILVRGSGDVASAVAARLFQAGYAVFIHDLPQPTVTRRSMSFVDAIFDGQANLDGLEAQLIQDPALLPGLLAAHEILPITTLAFEILLKELRPQVLVDARMKKHVKPENQRHLAALTIGLGPNFVAGETVHLAIETGRGESLGQVIEQGPTLDLAGEPAPIAGHGRDRYVYAPVAGIFRSSHQIGDLVEQGQELARLDANILRAPISGVLRGLIYDGVPVQLKTKLIEVDPRGAHAQISGIGERPDRIAQGVLQALRDRGYR
jgi:xanthine dehydrogenase accessory factor